MKKFAKIMAVVLALAMLLSLAACGSGNDDATQAEKTADSATSEALRGIFDTLLANETYQSIKSAYDDAVFEEKIDGDSIVITASGNEYVEGTYTFPVKDGYITCEVTGDDFIGPVIFNQIMGSVGEYYGIDRLLFSGYINGLAVEGIDSKFYSVDMNDDGTGTMQVYIEEKPEMTELDELYINDTALANFGDDTTNFTQSIGKIFVNCYIGKDDGTLAFAIGEYGDANTELTYKSIVEIVKFFEPTGYEAFLEDYTELTSVSGDTYTVSDDPTEYQQTYEVGFTEVYEGYKFMFVTFGASSDSGE